MRVGWILYGDKTEATVRYRALNIWQRLGELGIQCAPWKGQDCDVIVSQYRLSDDTIRALPLKVPLVFDSNDFVLLEGHAFSEEVSRNIWRVRLITCGTDALSTAYWRRFPSTPNRVIPDALDQEVFNTDWKRAIFQRKGGLPTLSWLGLPSTIAYLYEVEDVLYKLRDLYRHVEVVSSVQRGSLNLYDECKKLKFACKPIEWHRQDYLQTLAYADIGIVPLRSNSWCYYKGGHKVATMMALGLPVVASSNIEYGTLITKDLTGYIAFAPDEWEKPLRALLEDSTLRASIGRNASQSPELLKYGIEYGARQWALALRSVVSGQPRRGSR